VTQPTRAGRVGPEPGWKGPGMQRSDTDARPAAPAGSVANPRRTRLLRDALQAGRDDAERAGR
jgi:hypothetical protein